MRISNLITIRTKYIPHEIEGGYIYLSDEFNLAIHLCACGCGGKAVTPINIGDRGWIVTEGENGLTLRPSIGHQHWPCRSHYWVTDGKIEWC